jgi:hypothetical protein
VEEPGSIWLQLTVDTDKRHQNLTLLIFPSSVQIVEDRLPVHVLPKVDNRSCHFDRADIENRDLRQLLWYRQTSRWTKNLSVTSEKCLGIVKSSRLDFSANRSATFRDGRTYNGFF